MLFKRNAVGELSLDKGVCCYFRGECHVESVLGVGRDFTAVPAVDAQLQSIARQQQGGARRHGRRVVLPLSWRHAVNLPNPVEAYSEFVPDLVQQQSIKVSGERRYLLQGLRLLLKSAGSDFFECVALNDAVEV